MKLKRSKRMLRTFVSAGVLMALMVGGVACDDAEDEAVLEAVADIDTGADPAAGDADVGDNDTESFFDDAAGLEGEEITVTVEVVEVIGPNVFRFGQREASAQEYIAIHNATDTNLEIGDEVELSGMVVELDREKAEQEFGVTLDEVTFEPYEGEYGIHADSVEMASVSS